MAYTTWGSVCGGCGHRHVALNLAIRCLRKHQRGCVEQNGYSDRSVRKIAKSENILAPGSTGKGPGQKVPLSRGEFQ